MANQDHTQRIAIALERIADALDWLVENDNDGPLDRIVGWLRESSEHQEKLVQRIEEITPVDRSASDATPTRRFVRTMDIGRD